MLHILPCLDDEALAEGCRRDLDIPRAVACDLAFSTIDAFQTGRYVGPSGEQVDWRAEVARAIALRQSIPPEAALPEPPRTNFQVTEVEVTNETTLAAAKRLVDRGLRPLALNFANGTNPGGGFLVGALAQEEALCRVSALFPTLLDDPMYAAHRLRPQADSSDWALLSREVPVFRDDAGTPRAKPWPLDLITCAAPYAPEVGAEPSARLLRARIARVLAIAQTHGWTALVLGAWGCGAFGNDPRTTAHDFRDALEGPFRGAFETVIFAIADWSPKRRFLAPFRDVFA